MKSVTIKRLSDLPPPIAILKRKKKSDIETVEETSSVCSGCLQAVTFSDEAILCDRCQQWRHRLCGTDVSFETYKGMTDSSKSFVWICPSCERQQKQPKNEDSNKLLGKTEGNKMKLLKERRRQKRVSSTLKRKKKFECNQDHTLSNKRKFDPPLASIFVNESPLNAIEISKLVCENFQSLHENNIPSEMVISVKPKNKRGQDTVWYKVEASSEKFSLCPLKESPVFPKENINKSSNSQKNKINKVKKTTKPSSEPDLQCEEVSLSKQGFDLDISGNQTAEFNTTNAERLKSVEVQRLEDVYLAPSCSISNQHEKNNYFHGLIPNVKLATNSASLPITNETSNDHDSFSTFNRFSSREQTSSVSKILETDSVTSMEPYLSTLMKKTESSLAPTVGTNPEIINKPDFNSNGHFKTKSILRPVFSSRQIKTVAPITKTRFTSSLPSVPAPNLILVKRSLAQNIEVTTASFSSSTTLSNNYIVANQPLVLTSSSVQKSLLSTGLNSNAPKTKTRGKKIKLHIINKQNELYSSNSNTTSKLAPQVDSLPYTNFSQALSTSILDKSCDFIGKETNNISGISFLTVKYPPRCSSSPISYGSIKSTIIPHIPTSSLVSSVDRTYETKSKVIPFNITYSRNIGPSIVLNPPSNSKNSLQEQNKANNSRMLSQINTTDAKKHKNTKAISLLNKETTVSTNSKSFTNLTNKRSLEKIPSSLNVGNTKQFSSDSFFEENSPEEINSRHTHSKPLDLSIKTRLNENTVPSDGSCVQENLILENVEFSNRPESRSLDECSDISFLPVGTVTKSPSSVSMSMTATGNMSQLNHCSSPRYDEIFTTATLPSHTISTPSTYACSSNPQTTLLNNPASSARKSNQTYASSYKLITEIVKSNESLYETIDVKHFSPKPLAEWTEFDVREFFTRHDVENVGKMFEGINGDLLIEMVYFTNTSWDTLSKYFLDMGCFEEEIAKVYSLLQRFYATCNSF